MVVDYYKTLQIDRHAVNDDNLKKSYRKLAMRWHPDKNPSDKKEAEGKFKLISEAYEVLSDPQKRATYDRYCEEALRGPVRPPSSGAASSSSSGFSFKPRNANEVFSEAFGNASSFGRGSFANGSTEDILMRFHVGGGGAMSARSGTRQGAQIERTLACTLEELYNGTTKKMRILWEAIDSSGIIPAEEILDIEIKPGCRNRKRFTFSKLVFVVDEKPHSVFQRDGDDLIITQNISLVEALTGYTVQLMTLDRRALTIPIDSVISPAYVEVVKGEGMPITTEPFRKGDLRIKFQIMFPSKLTSAQKTTIKQVFS